MACCASVYVTKVMVNVGHFFAEGIGTYLFFTDFFFFFFLALRINSEISMNEQRDETKNI